MSSKRSSTKSWQSDKHTNVVVEEVDENYQESCNTEPSERVEATVEEPQEVTEQNTDSYTSNQEAEDEQVEILQRKKRRDTASQGHLDGSSSGLRNKLRRRHQRAFRGTPFGQLQPFLGDFGSLFGGFDAFGSMFSGMGPLNLHSFDDDDFWGGDNVEVYSYSSSHSIGPDGQVREQKASSKRVGGLKETTRLERDTREGREEVSYSREKGGRGRETRQRRDRSGKILKEDKYYNMTPEEAEQFEQDWSSSGGKTNRNLSSRSRDRLSIGYRSSNKAEY